MALKSSMQERGCRMVAMTEFEFLFVVDGVSVDDEPATSILTGDFDGVLSSNRGRTRYAVSGRGADSVDAAARLVSRLTKALPTLRVCHVDPDLVGIPDIAQRTGHSRQNILQWANGERNSSRPFPAPEGTAGRSFIWRWADVNEWLTPLGLGDGAARPTRAETTLIDAMLLEHGTSHGGRARTRVPVALNT
jgi:predicted DNA-binding transcriptional regulator AlpA